jgi:acetate kinase
MSILVINAGSSSLKFGLFNAEAKRTLATGLIDWRADPQHAELVVKPADGDSVHLRVSVSDHGAAVRHAIHRLEELDRSTVSIVGHRVVHGGERFHEPVRIDADVKKEIARLAELAPLHNPPALEAIEAAEAALPNVPHVAAFDTSFFSALEPRAFVYPLPYAWYTDWGIRRFGFHGLSHAYCTGRAAELMGRDVASLRLIVCHLGNGCSVSAVRGGCAVQTSMGYTPMEGLMMGTRSGSVDPGVMLHVQRKRNVGVEQLDQALNHESGLLGVSGASSDYRQVQEAAKRGEERARLALAIYADRVRATVGALAVTLGGIDALIFTAGVGEHSVELRAEVCRGLEILGLRLDTERNAACTPDSDIAYPDSPVRILVLRTQEELMIAREALRIAHQR